MSLLSDNYIIPVEKGTFYDATDILFTDLFINLFANIKSSGDYWNFSCK